MDANVLRKEWREALGRKLQSALSHDKRQYDVWTAKVNRIERIARREGIKLSE